MYYQDLGSTCIIYETLHSGQVFSVNGLPNGVAIDNIPDQGLITLERRNLYFYPFDQYIIEYSLEVAGITLDNGVSGVVLPWYFRADTVQGWESVAETTVIPSLLLSVVSSQFEAKFFPSELGGVPNGNMRIELYRTLPIRILTVAVLATIAIFILAIPTIKDTGSTLEVAVGVLFSLWGVRQVLIPDFITQTTIIDHSLQIFYLILALSLYVRFMIVPEWNRRITDSYNLDSEQKSQLESQIHIISESTAQSAPKNHRLSWALWPVVMTALGVAAWLVNRKNK